MIKGLLGTLVPDHGSWGLGFGGLGVKEAFGALKGRP